MLGRNQASLVKKSLVLRDGVLKRATLFPMFEASGKTRSLLLLDHDTGSVYELPFRRGLYKKPWFQSARLSVALAELNELSLERAYELTALWHFDPWWLLAKSPFRSLAVVPALKFTNCVDFMKETAGLYFASDLSAVSVRTHTDENGNLQFGGLKEVELPTREAWELPSSQALGWRLNPFWERKAG